MEYGEWYSSLSTEQREFADIVRKEFVALEVKLVRLEGNLSFLLADSEHKLPVENS